VGSAVKMDRAYIDEEAGQAICFWTAPDKKALEEIFQKAQVKTESIRQVMIHNG
jgi:phage-related protein